MFLTVVIPCFNEECSIVKMIQSLMSVLDAQAYEYEIIVINDGSTDNTLAVIKKYVEDNKKIKYISFSRNFGKESGILAGLSYAKGSVVVLMDADLQHPPELIPKMVTRLGDGFDQVIAKRNRSGDSLSKTFFAKAYYRLVNSLIDVELEDGVGDFRVLSHNAVNALLRLKEYNRFSKGLFSWIGFKTCQIEYQNCVRTTGKSKWSFSKLLQYGIDGILSFNNKPLRLCIGIGVCIIIMSICYMAFVFTNVIINGISVPGYFTTLSAILFMGAVQLISIGVVGEYIGRIYYEVKNRPHYIIEDSNIAPDQILSEDEGR